MRRDHLRDRFRDSKLSTAARFVFVMLDAHANKAGQAWPSVPTLADATGFGTTTVRAALRELETAGEIVSKPRLGQPTLYTIPNAPQRLALPHPNGIRAEPQRNSAKTPTPGVAKGFEGLMKDRDRPARAVENSEQQTRNRGGVTEARRILRTTRP